MEASIRTDTDL